MTKKHTLVGLIILVAGSLLITACNAQQPTTTEPTVDANMIYTQAAQTVQAGIAQTAASQPTATMTEMPAPTNTTDPLISAGMTATSQAILQPGTAGTAAPTQSGTTAGQPTLSSTTSVLPTATSAVVAPPPAATGDKAELTGQTPTDGTSIQKNATFTNTIVLKNVGTTTWTTAYQLVYYAGDRMGSPGDFNMPHEVKPNETVRLVFDMKADANPGTKRTIWAVQNANGVNFYDMWLEINVTN
jgi:hypothetical protein